MQEEQYPKQGDIKSLNDGYAIFDGLAWIKHPWSKDSMEEKRDELKIEVAKLQEENARLKRMLAAMNKKGQEDGR